MIEYAALVVQIRVCVSSVTLLFIMLPPCVILCINGQHYVVSVYKTLFLI